jgi:hypothetical protein
VEVFKDDKLLNFYSGKIETSLGTTNVKRLNYTKSPAAYTKAAGLS